MILSSAGIILCVILRELLMSIFGPLTNPTFSMGSNGFAPVQPATLWPALILFIPILLCAGLFLAGLGIYRSQSWGFNLGIILCSLIIIGGKGWAAFGVGGAIYCILGIISITRARGTS